MPPPIYKSVLKPPPLLEDHLILQCRNEDFFCTSVQIESTYDKNMIVYIGSLSVLLLQIHKFWIIKISKFTISIIGQLPLFPCKCSLLEMKTQRIHNPFMVKIIEFSELLIVRGVNAGLVQLRYCNNPVTLLSFILNLWVL